MRQSPDKAVPPQKQDRQPGLESEMTPKPRSEDPGHRGSGKLRDKVALVTGGDSGIGRAVAVAFAKEGADVGIAYLSEHEDAHHTVTLIEEAGRRGVAIPGDLSTEGPCGMAVERTVEELGRLDILVNNIAYQNPVDSFEEITTEQWDRTFKTNVYSYFWTTKAA